MHNLRVSSPQRSRILVFTSAPGTHIAVLSAAHRSQRICQAGEAADRDRDRRLGMKPAKLELQIEELVLRGFASGDRYRIGDAMEHELSRLFAEKGPPLSLAQGREVARLDGGAFEVKPGSRAEAIGVQVARAVYG